MSDSTISGASSDASENTPSNLNYKRYHLVNILSPGVIEKKLLAFLTITNKLFDVCGHEMMCDGHPKQNKSSCS